MDLVILSRGQVTRTTPELAPPSPNYHPTPPGGRLSIMHISPTRRVFSSTGFELVTCQQRSDNLTTRLLRPHEG
ncbi:hypothetical protein TNCV_3949261 [Trichonephila clavipes]|nr:hypothetical protein TNCV_3949261 [Trichonephila clavipes]